MRCRRLNVVEFVLLLALPCAASFPRAAGAENWPRFRGPNGCGISDEKGFPVTWSDGDYLWKTTLPGLGHSSPCVWDDHVFLTAAENEGRTRYVLDVSASTGKIRWQWTAESPAYKIHLLSSYA